MNKLLANAIEAHGSLERWKTFALIETDLASGGELLKWKGQRSSEPTHVVAHMHEQSCSISPVNSPAKRVVMKPDRVVLETTDGTLISERSDPRASFAGHDARTPWDPFHRDSLIRDVGRRDCNSHRLHRSHVLSGFAGP